MSSQRRGAGVLGHLAAEGVAQRRRLVGLQAEALAAAGVDDPVHVVAAVEVREEERRVGQLLLEQVEHGARRVRERAVGGGRRGRGSLDGAGVHASHCGRKHVTAGRSQTKVRCRAMRLATFLTPEGPAPHAGEVRGDRIVAFGSGSVLDRLASGDLTPADGKELRARRGEPARPGPAPARHLRHRPQLRRPRGRDRQGPARAADGVHEAAELERVAERHRRGPGRRRASASTTRASSRSSSAPATASPATRSPTTSPPATSRAASRSGRAPRASTPPAPGARGSRPPTRSPTPRRCASAHSVNGEVRQDSSTSDLVFGPQALVDFIAETMHARARRPHPHRHAGGRRPVDGPAAVPRGGRRRPARGRGPRRDRAHDRDRG